MSCSDKIKGRNFSDADSLNPIIKTHFGIADVYERAASPDHGGRHVDVQRGFGNWGRTWLEYLISVTNEDLRLFLGPAVVQVLFVRRSTSDYSHINCYIDQLCSNHRDQTYPVRVTSAIFLVFKVTIVIGLRMALSSLLCVLLVMLKMSEDPLCDTMSTFRMFRSKLMDFWN